VNVYYLIVSCFPSLLYQVQADSGEAEEGQSCVGNEVGRCYEAGA